MIAQHRKAIAALVGAVLTWGSVAQVDGVTAAEWWGLAVAAATALGVYGTTNDAAPDDGGQTNVVGAVLIVVLLLIVCRIFGLL